MRAPAFSLALTLYIVALGLAVFTPLSGVVYAQQGATSMVAPSGKPKAVVEARVFEFGSVSQGTKVEHEFKIQNRGDAELVIQRIVPSCGCTASSSNSDRVPPGGEAGIKVAFDTSGFSGEKLKTVRVYTNDMEENSLVLTMRGSIEPEILVEPRRVYFGDVTRGATGKVEKLLVKVREGSKSSITGVRSFSKYLTVKEVTSSPRERELHIELDPNAPLGELRDRLVIGISGARESSINVPVFAAVRGPIKIKPATVSFGVLNESEMTRSVKLENLGAKPIKITGVKTSDKAVRATVKEIKAGSLYVVDVKVDTGAVQRELRATVSVYTDSEEQRELSLAVYGALPPSA